MCRNYKIMYKKVISLTYLQNCKTYDFSAENMISYNETKTTWKFINDVNKNLFYTA